MPTGKEGNRFWERLVKLEIRVEGLMIYQRWQMGLLALIFLAALRAAMR